MSRRDSDVCELCSKIFDSPDSFARLTYEGPSASEALVFYRSERDILHGVDNDCSLCHLVYRGLGWDQSTDISDGNSDDSDGESSPDQDSKDMLESEDSQEPLKKPDIDENHPACLPDESKRKDNPDYIFRMKALTYPQYDPKAFYGVSVNYQCIEPESGPPAIEKVTWEHTFWIEANAPNSNAAEDFITSRPFIKDLKSTAVFQIARDRIETCNKDHEACIKKRMVPLPRRLIVIGETTRRVIETSSQQSGIYTTLSYCWGMVKQPVMATRETIGELRQGLPMDQLQASIEDAIDVTRQLGLRYLWVDSLCILQDDKDDKNQQISQIAEIFTNAYLTICATKASTCTEGFLSTPRSSGLVREDNQAPVFKDFQLPFTCPDESQGKLIIQPLTRFKLFVQPGYMRAWLFEERLLSSRVLMFGTDVVVWQCEMDNYQFRQQIERPSENDYVGKDDASDWDGVHDRVLQDAIFRQHHDRTKGQLPRLEVSWMKFVEAYSRRELTDPQDRLRAIGGLASRLLHAFKDYSYTAGIWFEKVFDKRASFGLCLLMWRQHLSSNDWANARLVDSHAPSWSWASVEGPVDMAYTGPRRDSSFYDLTFVQGCAKIIDCIADPMVPKTPFGRVRDAFLVIEGPLRTLQCVSFSDPGDAANQHHRWDVPEPRFHASSEQMDLNLLNCMGESRVMEFEGHSVDVSFLRLATCGGLMLIPAGDGAVYRRIGVFNAFDNGKAWVSGADDPADVDKTLHIDQFFEGSSVQVVKII